LRRNVEMSKSGGPLTQRHVPEVRNPQPRHCENLKTHPFNCERFTDSLDEL